MVAGSEIADVGQLEVADLRTAFLLRATGSGVVVQVVPPVMQEQKNGNDKKHLSCDHKVHVVHAHVVNKAELWTKSLFVLYSSSVDSTSQPDSTGDVL